MRSAEIVILFTPSSQGRNTHTHGTQPSQSDSQMDASSFSRKPLVQIVLDDVKESIDCDEGDVKVRVKKQNENDET